MMSRGRIRVQLEWCVVILLASLLLATMPSCTAFLPVHHPPRSRGASPTALHASSFSTEKALSNDKENNYSAVEFVDSETNTKVVLLGCLHGSKSSAAHVEQALLLNENTNVLVLELCASRFADLKRAIHDEPQSQQQGLRWFQVLLETIQKRGIATGFATAVLGGASGLQTALGGFEPGLEFTTAMKLVSNNEKLKDCDVILADQTVEETLERFGSLLSESLDMMQEFVERGLSWEETYGRESTALQCAVFGDLEYQPTQQVNMGRFLTQDPQVRSDLIRLTLAPLVFVQIFVSVLAHVLFQTHTGSLSLLDQVGLIMDMSSLSSTDMLFLASNVASDLISSAALLGLGYVTLALPATRLILCERDDQLARGVQAACRLAARQKKNNNDNARVVVVLGLLHVNGVAKRLLSKQNQ